MRHWIVEGEDMISLTRRNVLQVSGAAAAAAALAGCAQTSDSSSGSGSAASSDGITIGTTDKVTSLDPAAQYDHGSFEIISNVFPMLMNVPLGATDGTPELDVAESAEFTSPTEFTVKLRSGLKFANGHDLTAEDVKFSFDRQLSINDPNGPASLLTNLDSTEVVDDLTVVFKLKVENDQTFAQVLMSPAGPIMDSETFPADSVMSDEDIVAAQPFCGPYVIADYSKNQLVNFTKWDGYTGTIDAPQADSITLKYYSEAENLKLAVQQNEIDVAYRSLTATDIESLRSSDGLTVYESPGSEMRFIVFNFDTMPHGAQSSEPDTAKAAAVRQAVASVIDRDAIAEDVYKGSYTPLYSYIVQGFAGSTETLKSAYGDGNGGPDTDKAKQILSDAGVSTPVTLRMQYNPDHYGTSSADEYAAIKNQLEATDLFTVDLQSTEWVQYNKDRVSDVYPVYQLGWFPDFADPDNYLTPFFGADNFIHQHYENTEVQELITAEATTQDEASREQILSEVQEKLTADLPTIPLLQGKQIMVANSSVSGCENAMDIVSKLRLSALNK